MSQQIEDIKKQFGRVAVDEKHLQQKYDQIKNADLDASDVTAVYDAWAPCYDQDKSILADKQAIVYHSLIEMVLKACPEPKDIRILDIGAATGILGLKLKEAGFTGMDALDASSKMLDVAKQHNVYNNLYSHCLGADPVPIQTDTYNLVVSIGSFLHNHITEDCFEELIRITKPGGKMVITMHCGVRHQSYEERFLTKLNQLELVGHWKIKDKKHFEVVSAKSKAYIFCIEIC